jgi:DHA1 family tetracycline resistance protein-like MFS transporter
VSSGRLVLSDARTSTRNAAPVFIFITVILDMLSFGAIVPVLPRLVKDLVGGHTAIAAQIYGLLITIWALMQFIFSPVLGSLSDRFGRRPVVLLSNLGSGLDYVIMALAPSIGWLFLGRLISGITSSTFVTSYAYIADVVPAEKRAGSYGVLNAGFGLGFVAGPAVGGLLGAVSPRLPFWLAAGTSLSNAAYGFFILPESLSPERRIRCFEWQRANPIGSFQLLRDRTELLGLAIVHFVGRVANEVLPSVFVLYVIYRYGWGDRAVGLTLAVVGLCAAVTGAALVQPLVARYGDRSVVMMGLLFYAISFATCGLAPTGTVFLTGILIGGLGGLYPPPLRSMMTRRVGESEQGRLQGALSSLSGIAFMVGPLVFSQTFAGFVRGGVFRDLNLPGAPFLLAAMIAAVSMVIARRVTSMPVLCENK